MGRSFNTSLTLIFSILSLLLLGGGSIRDFLLVLLIGVTTGYVQLGVHRQHVPGDVAAGRHPAALAPDHGPRRPPRAPEIAVAAE